VIGIGDDVPTVELIDDRSHRWRLDAERDRPLVLIFHRHFY
jgi:hypothetical protein